MPKNIIKNQKIHSLKEFLGPKNCKNCQKGQKIVVFWPSRAEFFENQKKAQTFSYFYPREAVYQISENLAHQTWRKCVTADKRRDGTEIIGPSGKIPGTKNSIKIGSNKIFEINLSCIKPQIMIQCHGGLDQIEILKN